MDLEAEIELKRKQNAVADIEAEIKLKRDELSRIKNKIRWLTEDRDHVVDIGRDGAMAALLDAEKWVERSQEDSDELIKKVGSVLDNYVKVDEELSI